MISWVYCANEQSQSCCCAYVRPRITVQYNNYLLLLLTQVFFYFWIAVQFLFLFFVYRFYAYHYRGLIITLSRCTRHSSKRFAILIYIYTIYSHYYIFPQFCHLWHLAGRARISIRLYQKVRPTTWTFQ